MSYRSKINEKLFKLELEMISVKTELQIANIALTAIVGLVETISTLQKIEATHPK